MKKKILPIAAAVLVAVAAYFFKGPLPAPTGQMALHVLDVGQGDCLLLESDGEYGLIDSGNRENGDEIVAYLRSQGVRKLNFAAATHPHSDHIGGMAQVLTEIGAEQFYMSDVQNPTAAFERMLDAAAEFCNDSRLLYGGDTLKLGDANIEILSPQKGYSDDNVNNYSLVMQVEAGGCRLLLTGDSERQAEEIYAGSVLPCDILKVGHHGSDTSTSSALLQSARPKIAVISCGSGNSYGHPNSDTLNNLAKAEVYRTDLDGTIVFTIKDGEINVKKQ